MANVRIKSMLLTHASGVSINTDEMPQASVEALLTYGYNHFIGNVQQAKRTNSVRATLAEEQGVKPSAITTAAVRDWNEKNPEEAKRILDEFMQDALVELREGTVGIRESKPRIDERTKMFNAEVASRLKNFLKGQGLALEKDEDHAYPVRGSGGTVVNRTAAQLRDGLVTRKGPEIYAKIDQILAERAAAESAGADFGVE